jgi:hypothetical protein
MPARLLAVAFGLGSVLGAATVTRGDGRTPVRQAVTYLAEPTLIGSTIVQGPVLITHDDDKMARGEPCTTVQLFEPGTEPAEEIAAFHCIPISRRVVDKFTVRTKRNAALGFGCILTEYQFAGDAEGHGVPSPANAP